MKKGGREGSQRKVDLCVRADGGKGPPAIGSSVGGDEPWGRELLCCTCEMEKQRGGQIEWIQRRGGDGEEVRR